MLKDWLVRRRENPYPSREEKKSLAQKTGLTYIQVGRPNSINFDVSKRNNSILDLQLVRELAAKTKKCWQRAAEEHLGKSHQELQ